MTSWLVSQILPLSALLAALLGLQQVLRDRIGATARYAIWLCVPVYLIGDALLPSTPVDFIPVSYTVTTQTVDVAASTHVSFDPYLLMWCSGMGLMLLFHSVRFHQFVSSLHLRKTAPGFDSWSGRVEMSERAVSPFVLGLLQPKLVLPHDFYTRYSPEQQRLIIAHEQTHVRHLDPLWNAIAHIFVVMFWFHPLMWLAYKHFRTVQEEACDQAVIARATKQQRVSYAHALVQCASEQSFPLTALRFGDKKIMENRVVNALEAQPQKMTGLFITLTFACLLGMSLSVITVAKEMEASKADHKIHPLKRIEPWYPIQAAEQKIEGSVTLRYDIEKDGTVTNVSVVNATPENVFNKSASKALAKWTYAPSAQKHQGVLVQLDYVLDEPGAKEAIDRHDGQNEMVLVENR